MEKAKRTVGLAYIRGLLVAQEGWCAISGRPLQPDEVNADHIIALSRVELNPSQGEENFWLVDKKINALKGTLTYDELVTTAREIIAHEQKTRALLGRITGKIIDPMDKTDFDQWVGDHCYENGAIKE